uniref:AHNK n=1 Tax=Rhabditophanes sp. KR3021 TaxID=114890 RepID=A0AC35UCG7_9BILA
MVEAKNSDDNLDPFGDIEKRTEEADSTSFEKANKLKSKDGVFELDKNARKLPAPLPSSSLGHYENTGILKDLGDVVNVNGGIAVPVPTNDPVKVGLKFGLGFGKGGRAGGMPEFLPIPRQGYLYSLNDFDGYQNPTPNRAYKYWKKVYHIPDSNEKIEEDVEKDTKIRSRNEPKDPFSKQ